VERNKISDQEIGKRLEKLVEMKLKRTNKVSVRARPTMKGGVEMEN
jgi:hypothetical protein